MPRALNSSSGNRVSATCWPSAGTPAQNVVSTGTVPFTGSTESPQLTNAKITTTTKTDKEQKIFFIKLNN
ncbi:hypothetical protein IKN40_02120 [bacterium]|nr:hypothetical protein [bacterium]